MFYVWKFTRLSRGYTAFHLAARRGDVDFLAVLKAFQFPVNLPGPGGRTALHEAVLGNQLDSVQYLLHHGAKHDAKTLDGETALDLARKMGLKDNDRLIVSLGIFLNSSFTYLNLFSSRRSKLKYHCHGAPRARRGQHHREQP